MRRVLTVLAVFATLVLALSSFFVNAGAQQTARPGVQAAHEHASAASPIVIASGEQYAGVRGLAVDAAHNLYISLTANPPLAQCVSRAASDSSNSRTDAKIAVTVFSNCASAPGEEPSGIAATPEGRVFLANRAQNRIRALDMATGRVAVVPAAKSSARASSSNLDLFEPAGLAIDAAQDLYIADRGNYRVLTLSPGAAHFSYLAHVLDAAAIAVDSARGELFVASPASNRIFEIDLDSGGINAFAGSGESSDPSDARFSAPISALSATILSPEGIAVDGVGNVFIADTGANAILRVDAKSGMLSRAALAAELNSPGALAIDRRGDLFVADRGNHRVAEFAGVAAAAASGVITISPAQHDFGAEPTGGATPPQIFTLANNSTNALSLSTTSFTFTGANAADFNQTNNCIPQVAAGASCQINVTFAPQATGARTAMLQVTDADPSSPQTAQLSGTGDDFQITAASGSPTTQNVIPGKSATYNLQIMPDNTFSGTVTPACPLQLPNSTLTCSVNPATVSVTAGQPAPFTVTIGTGGPNATAFAAPAPWNFPNAPMRGLFLAAFCAAALLLLFSFLRGKLRPEATPVWSSPNARRRSRFAVFVFAVCAAAAVAGCYHRPSNSNPNETPPGIFKIDISATAQNASRAITLTLNVN